MDFFIIPPLKHLDLMNLGQRYFCLAQHYLKSEEYRQFFKNKVKEGKWVLLDNGIGDHSPVTQNDLFDIMVDLKPNEVIPVDTLFNKDQTLLNLDSFIKKMDEKNLLSKIEIFACPQGYTKDEWLECYSYMLEHPNVNTIGMSKLSIPWCFKKVRGDVLISESRHLAFDYLRYNDLLNKPLHFLGMGDPNEFQYYINYNDHDDSMIRSSDSCYSVLAAINGISFKNGNFQRIPTPKNYFDLEMTEDQIDLAKENIQYLLENNR
jgi:hypothetical protein